MDGATMIQPARPPVRIAIVGAGKVSDYHHVPGIRLDSRAKLVAACDADPKLLDARRKEWAVEKVTTDFQAIVDHKDIDAIVIATPNFTHRGMAVAAAKAGKHIMCEK